MQAMLAAHQKEAQRYGLNVRLIETWRDEATQALDFAKGRDAQGRVINPAAVVTNAQPGASYHGVSLPDGTPAALAYHLALVTPGNDLVVGTRDDLLGGFGAATLDAVWVSLYGVLGKIGERMGLTWGGRWQDFTHFEKRFANLPTLADIRGRLMTGQVLA